MVGIRNGASDVGLLAGRALNMSLAGYALAVSEVRLAEPKD